MKSFDLKKSQGSEPSTRLQTASSLSPKKVAAAIGASESSLKRWCDRGLIQFEKTAGGHRRIPPAAVLKFLQNSKHRLEQPEVLGLSKEGLPDDVTTDQAVRLLADAFVAGEEPAVQRLLADLYIRKNPISFICDAVIQPALELIGESNSPRTNEGLPERRGSYLAAQFLAWMKGVGPGTDEAPRAVGGSLAQDSNPLSVMMAEVVLQQNGWMTQSLGSSLSFETLAVTAQQSQPQAIWVILPEHADSPSLHDDLDQLRRRIGSTAQLVLIGEPMVSSGSNGSSGLVHCRNMQQLESFAQSSATHSQAPQMDRNPADDPMNIS